MTLFFVHGVEAEKSIELLVRDTVVRCKRCKYTFHYFSNRWINELRFPYKKWLWIIKFFEVELSARKIAQQLGFSYPTILEAVTIL
jgi:transposase